MTATVKEFCRINGLDENAENLVDKIYSALAGGDADRNEKRPDYTGKEVETTISNGTA